MFTNHLTIFMTIALSSSAIGQTIIPQNVDESLRHNVMALSPVTVEWERTRTSFLSAQEIVKRLELPAHLIDILAPQESTFAWQERKFFASIRRNQVKVNVEGEYELDQPFEMIEQQVAFDRMVFYNGAPNEGLGNASIIKEHVERVLLKEDPDHMFGGDEYLKEAGFQLSQRADMSDEVPRHALHEVLDDAVVEIVEPRTADRHDCLAVRMVRPTGESVEFVLDRKREFAVRERLERSSDGSLLIHAKCGQFQRLRPKSDLWLPRRITVDRYQLSVSNSQPLMTDVYTAKVSGHSIPDSTFSPHYDAPGTFVTDTTVPGVDRVSYQVPARPSDLDAAIEAAVERQQFSPKSRFWRSKKFMLYGNLGLCAVVGIVWWLRRNR